MISKPSSSLSGGVPTPGLDRRMIPLTLCTGYGGDTPLALLKLVSNVTNDNLGHEHSSHNNASRFSRLLKVKVSGNTISQHARALLHSQATDPKIQAKTAEA